MAPKILSRKKTQKKMQDTGHHQRRRERFEVQSRADLDKKFGYKTQFGARNTDEKKSRLFGFGRSQA
jgi:hypothetical protein